MRILIAEDEPVSRLRLKAQLTRWGYEVLVARDGHEAWDLLQGEDPPRLAILDWMMPGLDGTEICKKLRSERPEPYIYVILLTGRGSTEDLVMGLDAGADDYVTKPFDAQELQVRLRTGRRLVELQAELVATREALRFQATHDTLTGAWNRAAAMDTLRREVARAERSASELAVAMIDLDHFKAINDTHGHPGGDEVLREIARRCQGSVRPYDTFARYGGEEFILVLPTCTETTALVVAERIREQVCRAAVDFGGRGITVSCSIGVATWRLGSTQADLVARADAALYLAKHCGRNRVELAGAGMLEVKAAALAS